MPLIATRGAASAQGFGEFAQTVAPVYIEDVFSTYLYTGNGTGQTITNNIDLSTKGGLVWLKDRTSAAHSNWLTDTARGVNFILSTNSTNAQINASGTYLTSFNSNGFSINGASQINTLNNNLVSWTFRKQPKFFDIVTYTGNGTNGRAISHALASSPGCVIIKSLNNSGTGYDGWYVRHRSATGLLYLNLTNAQEANFGSNITALSSTTVTVGGDCNENGETYVMYLFAHDAGGFGTSGSDNVISCGYFSGSVEVNLGYEAQWVLIKDPNNAGAWYLFDTMRGMSQTQGQGLSPNTSGAESAIGAFIIPTATGFKNVGGGAYIYIAIRRGPMKTPTSGTSVFTPVAYTGNGTARTTVTDIVTDLSIIKRRNTAYNPSFEDRLRGANQVLESNTNAAEIATAQYILGFDVQNGVRIGTDVGVNQSGSTFINWAFSRAPGFFDVVCYTGTGANTTISHNLGVAPELIICKSRSSNPGANWVVWNQTLNSSTGYLYLNDALQASNFAGVWNGAPTSTYFTLGTNYQNNNSGTTFVAYLFTTLAGVSKVGSYTGSTSVQTINCGFTNGARFVLIKRTDAAGNWIVYDSARGIVAGNDPYLLLNKSDAEDGGDDDLEADSSGFIVNPTPDGISNPGINGATYIFLAIA